MNKCKPATARMLALSAATAALVLSAAHTYAGTVSTEGQTCMQRVFIGNTSGTVTQSNQLNCTANDVNLSKALSAINLDTGKASCVSGTTFTLQATFQTIVTATSRYDETYFFRLDGGASARGDGTAATGLCSVTQLDNNGPGSKLDGDTCGDLNAGTYTFTATIPGVKCVDTTGDGNLNLPNCTSWHSNQGTVCNLASPGSESNVFTTNPDTKSKCTCNDTFKVPVAVEPADVKVTKSPNPSHIQENTPTDVVYTATVTNNGATNSATVNSLIDSLYGDVTTTGHNGITATDCSVPQTIAPGASYPCTFTVHEGAHEPGDSIKDTVCASGTTSGDGPFGSPGACGDAVVTIDDKQPTASVFKKVLGASCAEVQYQVQVVNTDSVDVETLTALSDSLYGDITQSQLSTTPNPKVISTTCSVPQSLLIGDGQPGGTDGDTYTCTFTARACNGDVDVVTVTVKDDEGHVITPAPTGTVKVTGVTAGGTAP
jgi:hypothetical protein